MRKAIKNQSFIETCENKSLKIFKHKASLKSTVQYLHCILYFSKNHHSEINVKIIHRSLKIRGKIQFFELECFKWKLKIQILQLRRNFFFFIAVPFFFFIAGKDNFANIIRGGNYGIRWGSPWKYCVPFDESFWLTDAANCQQDVLQQI